MYHPHQITAATVYHHVENTVILICSFLPISLISIMLFQLDTSSLPGKEHSLSLPCSWYGHTSRGYVDSF